MPTSWNIDLITDITGYYAPQRAKDPNMSSPALDGLYYYPLSKPFRMLDSSPSATVGVYAGGLGSVSLSAGNVQSFQFSGVGAYPNAIPASARVLSCIINIESTTGQTGSLTLYPGPADPGGAFIPVDRPTILLTGGQLLSASVPVLLDESGVVNIYPTLNTGSSLFRVVIDVVGWYGPALNQDPNSFTNGLVYYPLPAPTRFIDTRSDATVGLYLNSGTIAANSAVNFDLHNVSYSGNTIPSAARALVANCTAITGSGNTTGGFLTIYPGGSDPTGAARPIASMVDFGTGVQYANCQNIFALGTGGGNAGKVNFYASIAQNIVVDVAGYYAPPNTSDPNHSPSLSPDLGLMYFPLRETFRLVDTRIDSSVVTGLYRNSGPLTGASVGSAAPRQNYEAGNITYNGLTVPFTAKAIEAVMVAITTNVVSGGGSYTGGYITVWSGPADPTGTRQPITAQINYLSQNQGYIPNAVTIALGAAPDMTINLYAIAT